MTTYNELNLLTASEVATILRCSPRVISEQAEKRWEGFPKARRVTLYWESVATLMTLGFFKP